RRDFPPAHFTIGFIESLFGNPSAIARQAESGHAASARALPEQRGGEEDEEELEEDAPGEVLEGHLAVRDDHRVGADVHDARRDQEDEEGRAPIEVARDEEGEQPAAEEDPAETA